MKSTLGAAFLVAAVFWLIYTGFADTPCERVYRSGIPVRLAFDVLRWGTRNFVSQEARLEQLKWSIDADASTQKFAGKLLYGSKFTTQTCEE